MLTNRNLAIRPRLQANISAFTCYAYICMRTSLNLAIKPLLYTNIRLYTCYTYIYMRTNLILAIKPLLRNRLKQLKVLCLITLADKTVAESPLTLMQPQPVQGQGGGEVRGAAA